MFRTLRDRLIFSHILPTLLVIPLMGSAMVYILETRLLLPLIYQNLSQDAALIAEITRNQPVFWQDPAAAQSLADGVSPYLSGRVSFVSLDGALLASSPADGGVPGQVVELPSLAGVVQGEVVRMQQGALAEAFTPVYDLRGRPIGVIRMTTRLVTVSDQIYQMRYLLVTVLLAAVLAGVLVGSWLAFSINRPIQRVTHSIETLAKGRWQAHVPEEGPAELRSLARAVNDLVDQLDTLEKTRRTLLANLVHELGRPLGAVRSAIQALRKGADRDPQLAADLLTGMDGETARLEHLLDNLAGLYDQVLGRVELRLEPVNLAAWLPAALAPWEAAAREKGLDWSAELPPGLPIVVIDPDRTAQAAGNLLSNAVKFTPAGGRVLVSAAYDGGWLTLRVADSGPGIPPAEQERVFQPFYRGAGGRRIIQGMGLGLSITREIAAAHGGEVLLESAPGQGSAFTLRIPAELPKEV